MSQRLANEKLDLFFLSIIRYFMTDFGTFAYYITATLLSFHETTHRELILLTKKCLAQGSSKIQTNFFVNTKILFFVRARK